MRHDVARLIFRLCAPWSSLQGRVAEWLDRYLTRNERSDSHKH